jgi:hypothetical protein
MPASALCGFSAIYFSIVSVFQKVLFHVLSGARKVSPKILASASLSIIHAGYELELVFSIVKLSLLKLSSIPSDA